MAIDGTQDDGNSGQTDARQITLPALREEIDLHAGPAEADGYPTWTLYDPVTNQFFRLGWQGFEVLTRLDRFSTVGQLLDDINAHTSLKMQEGDVLDIIRFLYDNELALSVHPQQAKRLAEKAQKRKAAWWKQAMHSYLFLRIPLVRPDNFLAKTQFFVRPLFTRQFFILMLVLAIIAGLLTFFRIDEFTNTFMHFFTWQGLVIYILSLVFVKSCHELAHAYRAKLSGVEVSVMGVAFIVLYPVLYTDTSGAWKLADKRRRLQIGYAGVMAEFYLAICALLLWHIVPESAFKSAAFFIATVSFAMTVLVNFNPLMRFDGYYLLSDMLGVDNLQARSFALTKWHLRRWLLGVKAKKPENFKPSLHKSLIGYGYATWVYRFFLFLGIAILIFYLFPQPLGLVFMLVELGFFIALPILQELKVWWKEREKIPARGRRASIGIVIFIVLFMAVPWSSSVTVPAIMQSDAYQKVTVPVAARVDKIVAAHGQHVKKGDVLVILESDLLNSKIDQARRRLDILAEQIRITQRNQDLIKEQQALISQRVQAQTHLNSLLAMREQLNLRAAITGQVFYAQDALHVGLSLAAGDVALEVVGLNSRPAFHAYVNERDYSRISTKARGVFYPDNALHRPLRTIVQDIDTFSTRQLDDLELASRYGGSIAVEQDAKSEKLTVHEAIYRLRIRPADDVIYQGLPTLRVRGVMRIDGQTKSMFYSTFVHVRALIVREFGI